MNKTKISKERRERMKLESEKIKQEKENSTFILLYIKNYPDIINVMNDEEKMEEIFKNNEERRKEHEKFMRVIVNNKMFNNIYDQIMRYNEYDENIKEIELKHNKK